MCSLVAALEDPSGACGLDEIVLLLSNLGVPVRGRVLQKKKGPDPAMFLGRGKALEIRDFAAATGANLLVVDDFLSPTQRANLGKATGLEVWDRAYTIMMVFDRRAVTMEAKLQVELARLRHEIPSLKGLGHQMSRLGGGIGTRGPGETEFERHRRKLERRIKHIERRLGDVRNRRGRNRYRRSREGVGIVSLAGYTNSGKSTLLRALSRDPGIVAEDRLFSTLDTVIRRVASPGGGSFLLSDTVGFIRNLPTELVAAFRSTLEEVTEADLLYVVLDAAAPEPMTSFEVVLKTLGDIGAGEIPRIVVLNKVDRAGENAVFVQAELASRGEETARVSAISGEGLPELTERTCERLMSIKEKSTGTEPAASRGFVRS